MTFSQKGNALFLILIAVALFAVLSYAVVQSGRGSGDINREQAILISSQALTYASTVQQTIQKMQLLYGCSDYNVSFESAVATWDYVNVNSSPASCKVFDPQGGGLAFLPPPAGANDGTEWVFSANGYVDGINPKTQLFMLLKFVDRDVCIALNNQLDIVDTGSLGDPEIPYDSSQYPGHFTGSSFKGDGTTTQGYSGAGPIREGPLGAADPLYRKTAGCFENATDGGFHFYYMLIHHK